MRRVHRVAATNRRRANDRELVRAGARRRTGGSRTRWVLRGPSRRSSGVRPPRATGGTRHGQGDRGSRWVVLPRRRDRDPHRVSGPHRRSLPHLRARWFGMLRLFSRDPRSRSSTQVLRRRRTAAPRRGHRAGRSGRGVAGHRRRHRMADPCSAGSGFGWTARLPPLSKQLDRHGVVVPANGSGCVRRIVGS